MKARLVRGLDSAGDTIFRIVSNKTDKVLGFFRDKERAEEYLKSQNEGRSFMAKALRVANNRRYCE